MIDKFVERWEKRKGEVRAIFEKAHPSSYEEIVKAVCQILGEEHDWHSPDPSNIHSINDGDYKGTLVFIIPESGYQPSAYWAVTVGYGSCSGCDTLKGISDYSDSPPTQNQIEQYMTLALHILQGIKEI